MSDHGRAGRSTKSGNGLRGAAALAAFAASLFALVWFNGRADDGWGGLDRLREELRSDGYALLGWYFSAVLVAAVLQSLPAWRRRARLGAGWLSVAVLILYGLGVAGLAALLAPHAPGYHADVSRSDPGGIYAAMLVCMLGGPALLALSGAVFPDRAVARGTQGQGPAKQSRPHGEDESSPWGYQYATLFITALLGTVSLLLLLVFIAVG